jgi:cytochrome c biogenesis protein CcmG/thiol:disulfide interchange protein DsbE
MTPDDGVEDVHERSSVLRPLGIAAGVAGVILVAYLALRPAPEGAPGGSAPAFELQMLGSDRTLSSIDLADRPVVLNLWASWCVPCRREMPLLEQISQRYEDDVTIVGINVQDAPVNAEAFVDEVGATYPIVRDPEATLAEPLTGVPKPGLPQTFFVDEGWRLSGDPVLGELSEDQLVEGIERMIGDEEG